MGGGEERAGGIEAIYRMLAGSDIRSKYSLIRVHGIQD